MSFVLTCLTFLRTLCVYVPSCLRLLHACILTCLRALIFQVPTCLGAYIFFVPMAELLKKSGKVKMEIIRLRCLALGLFKAPNNLNPYYMKEIFSKTTNQTHNQNNTTKYRNKGLRSLGHHIWNSLHSEIKETTEYKI